MNKKAFEMRKRICGLAGVPVASTGVEIANALEAKKDPEDNNGFCWLERVHSIDIIIAFGVTGGRWMDGGRMI